MSTAGADHASTKPDSAKKRATPHPPTHVSVTSDGASTSRWVKNTASAASQRNPVSESRRVGRYDGSADAVAVPTAGTPVARTMPSPPSRPHPDRSSR